MELSAHGITAQLPAGWEGRIMRRTEVVPDQGGESGPAGVGEALPVAHLANFGLPEDRGDFGSGAVEIMRTDDVLICLLEYGPECVGTTLFPPTGLPRSVTGDQFASRNLQRTIAGQGGLQLFFTEGGRAFCIYVVLGRQAQAGALLPTINAALAAITIEPR